MNKRYFARWIVESFGIVVWKLVLILFEVVFGNENPFDLYGNDWDDEKGIDI